MSKPKQRIDDTDEQYAQRIAEWKERISARMKAYREANKERISARMKAYYEANKDRISAQKKAHYEANKERMLAQRSVRYERTRFERTSIPIGMRVYSVGEEMVRICLDEMGVEYKREKRFAWLRCESQMRLDFYLPELNMAIEYDGAQHKDIVAWYRIELKNSKRFGDVGFDAYKMRDELKDRLCAEHGIKVVRIDKSIDNIEKMRGVIREILNTSRLEMYKPKQRPDETDEQYAKRIDKRRVEARAYIRNYMRDYNMRKKAESSREESENGSSVFSGTEQKISEKTSSEKLKKAMNKAQEALMRIKHIEAHRDKYGKQAHARIMEALEAFDARVIDLFDAICANFNELDKKEKRPQEIRRP